jgi:hypothetical protein
LARVASPQISAFFAELHQSHEVGLHIGANCQEILQKDGTFTGVQLDDGSQIVAE